MNTNYILEYNEIYRINFPDDVSFKFRLLTLKEVNYYTVLLEGGFEPSFFIYEDIFSKCFLGKASFISEHLKAGYTISTGGLIYYLSSEGDKDKILFDIAKYRKRNPEDSIIQYMISVILMSFRNYKLKELKLMTRNELIELFVVAENMLGKTNPDYKKLDLQKIYEENNKVEKPKKVFKAENSELEKALGAFKIEEAEELMKKENLTKQQLRNLDLRGR